MARRLIEPEILDSDGRTLEEPIKIFPKFHIDLQSLPEAREWEIGEVYRVVLDIRQTGLHIHHEADGDEKGGADFDIVALESLGLASVESKLPDR
jgi:hypothetical protein